MAGPVGTKLLEKLPQKGLIGLCYWELGFRQVTNSKRPVVKAEDIEGLKLRVLQAPISIDTFSAWGANPVPLPFPELYTAMKQEAVDGQENPVTLILESKFFEVQKFLSLTRHVYNPQAVLISKKTWGKLSADEQKIIQEAAKEATAYQRQVAREENAKALEALKKSMQVNEVSPQEITRLKQKAKPVIDKYTQQVGEPLVKELEAEVAKVRGGK